ncbi:SMI1/KNR4 family protein [Actinacidiphila glaucinigra]|uniref:hypothetical protein n=1 Tax=Actinacidiphila glaucinigra TaxID=235986 RepID=UPI00324471E8
MARFEDLRRTLWDPGNRYGVQPPLTGRLVAEAERALRVTLPGSLLDLLRHQNGGVVAADRDAFPTGRPNSWSADHVPFETLMGIGRQGEALSLLDSPYLVREWGLPTPVALVSGGGHTTRTRPADAWRCSPDRRENRPARAVVPARL